MKIKDMMTTKPTFLFPDTTVQEAATTMKAIKTGFLPVGDGERVAGVITDRDIALRVCGKGRVPACTKVEQVMTRDVIYAYEDKEIGEAAKMMGFYGIRRLIILDRDKRMTGIVTRGDLKRWVRDSPQKPVLEGRGFVKSRGVADLPEPGRTISILSSPDGMPACRDQKSHG